MYYVKGARKKKLAFLVENSINRVGGYLKKKIRMLWNEKLYKNCLFFKVR